MTCLTAEHVLLKVAQAEWSQLKESLQYQSEEPGENSLEGSWVFKECSSCSYSEVLKSNQDFSAI